MAAWRAILPGLLRKILPFGSPANRRWSGVVRLAGAALGGAGAMFTASRLLRDVDSRDLLLLRVRAQNEVVIDDGKEKQSLRKQRFMQFASLEFEGEHFMTPRDFLFSVMFEQVERKTSSKKLSKKELETMLSEATKVKPGAMFFRALGDKGLISYTEYLFLLTILTTMILTFDSRANTKCCAFPCCVATTRPFVHYISHQDLPPHRITEHQLET